tara:strand:+ start:271 stop:450 length:180 start_codon:yes stop_codon:yes gene_type:complete
MTYEIAQQIANGNQEALYKTFATLVKTAQESGMSLNEAKRDAKAMLNCMVNAWNKTQAI